MKTYEISYIISSKITSEEANKVAKEIESAAQSAEGIILKTEKPAVRMLAYPIKKQSSGYFVSLDFQIEESRAGKVREAVEKNGNIIRCFLAAKSPVKELKRKRVRDFSVMSEIYKAKEATEENEKKGPVK